MIWFTSDTHFGHRGIIKHCNRGFDDINDMDRTIIDNWNRLINKDDEVYHIGDVSFHNWKLTRDILYQLNGRIYLLEGNHDEITAKKCADRFEWVKDYYLFRHEGVRAVLCHYPFATWRNAHHGAWNLHGHSHGSLRPKNPTRVDVGVDCWGMLPISLPQLREHLVNAKYQPVDHHEEHT